MTAPRHSSEPVVSVIIPCYNGEMFIRDAIESVLRQTYRSIQVVVVDDASTDRSWALIDSYGEALVAERNASNHGACYSRNRGAALSSGRYLMFLDADDSISSDTIEGLVGAMRSPGAELAACKWNFLMKAGESWVPVDPGFSEQPPEGDFLLAWLGGWYIPPCALLWERSAFDALGGWDESLAANQDGDLVLRALLRGTRIHKADTGLGLYRKQPGVQATISTTVSPRTVQSRLRVFRKVEDSLHISGTLDRYRVVLGRSYYELAREAYSVDAETARDAEGRAWALAGKRAPSGTRAHRFLAAAMGLRRKEWFAMRFRKMVAAFRHVVAGDVPKGTGTEGKATSGVIVG